jgi:transcriptional regulator with XRE-family HTH domain
MTVRTRSDQETSLRAFRVAFGITQAELAARTGVHRSLVSRIERGLVPSWPRFRQAASQSLGVPEATLFPPPGSSRRASR